MENANKKSKYLTILVTAVITVTVTMALAALVLWRLLGGQGLAMLQSQLLIRHSFVAPYDEKTAGDAALAAMADSLGDRWTVYLTPEQYAAARERRENAYVGVGITYTADEDMTAMLILSVTPGSPAEKAGIQAGESIVAVNGIHFTPENFQEIADMIPGDPGKVVTFTVRNGREEREAPVTLAKVEDSPVEYAMLEGEIGYIRIDNFYDRCAADAMEAVRALEAEGARALLFDVRANPGGYVSEMTALLDALLPEGAIFAEHSKAGPVRVVQSDAACVSLPMAVLADGNSYSAAELFAAQLRESAGVPVIGQTTCGKGYYQQIFPLVNGGALNLSTGMYTTGGGVSLIGVGLVPDYPEDDPELQLDKALSCIQERLGG